MSTEPSPMGIFECYLSLWVGLCIVAGVGLGLLVPGTLQTIASLEYASVNLGDDLPDDGQCRFRVTQSCR